MSRLFERAMNTAANLERRSFLKLSAAFGAFSTVFRRPTIAAAEEQILSKETKMTDANAKITVERRGHIVLIGINRPGIHNRIDPDTFAGLGKAYYQYDADPSLRAAVLFGHGENFSRGIDVDAYQAHVASGRHLLPEHEVVDPLATSAGRLSKPLIAVVHGDTWNMGHELFLAADIRVAAVDTRFGQDESSHGRFPGGGATVRFVHEAGWGNAMRYMLTGEHWSADDAFRMGVVQEIAPTAGQALEAGLRIAERVAGCAPLGIRTTLASAHLAVAASQAEALANLSAQYAALYKTEDFKEGRRAEAEDRPPIYQGR